MTDLSPQTQAVLDAYGAKLIGGIDAMRGSDRPCLSAALRAAADQLQERKPRPSIGIDWSSSELYTIAAELEGL